MEIGTLAIGIIIGLVIGGALGAVLFKSLSASSEKKLGHNEQELKALLALQARQHLDLSRNALNEIQSKTAELARQLNDYEETLTQATTSNEDTKDTFFGEHASLFLRNNLQSNKHDIALAQPDAQPRDFANSGSGVFVGVEAEVEKENKSQA